MMLTEALHQEFYDRGVIRIEGLLDPADVEVALEAVWKRLARHDCCAENEWRKAGERSTAINAGSEMVKGLDKSPAFQQLITSRVTDVVQELLGEDAPSAMVDHCQLLFTLPNSATWHLPHQVWHLDVPRLTEGVCPGVQVFACLNEIEPGGGATLIVAGSHRLLNAGEFIRSRDVKKRLKRDPWFRALMSNNHEDRSIFLREPGHVGDVQVQVKELCGKQGDVYFVDMRTLHTVAPNASSRPRVMVTQRYLRESCREAIFGAGRADAGSAS